MAHQDIPDLLAFARTAATTVFHPTSTRRIGSHATAVADASIMLTVVSDNTNAAVIIIGEMGVDMIRQDAAAP